MENNQEKPKQNDEPVKLASVLNTLLYLIKNKLYTPEHPEYHRIAIYLGNGARNCHGIDFPEIPNDQEDLVLADDEMTRMLKLREQLYDERLIKYAPGIKEQIERMRKE
jgi:hypothetical protein